MPFPNLERACKKYGPPRYEHICPESLTVIQRILDLLDAETVAEYHEFMKGMRRLFGVPEPEEVA